MEIIPGDSDAKVVEIVFECGCESEATNASPAERSGYAPFPSSWSVIFSSQR